MGREMSDDEGGGSVMGRGGALGRTETPGGRPSPTFRGPEMGLGCVDSGFATSMGVSPTKAVSRGAVNSRLIRGPDKFAGARRRPLGEAVLQSEASPPESCA